MEIWLTPLFTGYKEDDPDTAIREMESVVAMEEEQGDWSVLSGYLACGPRH